MREVNDDPINVEVKHLSADLTNSDTLAVTALSVFPTSSARIPGPVTVILSLEPSRMGPGLQVAEGIE
jgi:hypothetical protein